MIFASIIAHCYRVNFQGGDAHGNCDTIGLVAGSRVLFNRPLFPDTRRMGIYAAEHCHRLFDACGDAQPAVLRGNVLPPGAQQVKHSKLSMWAMHTI